MDEHHAPDASAFFARSWIKFETDPDVASWAAAAGPVAVGLAGRADLRERWLRCDGTWFAGVNVLDNDASGAVAARGVPPLAGAPVRFVAQVLGLPAVAWDRAQVSICYPGYPQPWDGESEAAFRYRRDRDAAHVDGLIRQMPGRRRTPGESHAFILGLPLTDVPAQAAPMVVWEGSHEIIRRAFRARLTDVPARDWSGEDVTDVYWAARREVFETCPRRVVHARPGEAYLVHRLALHGVAPWGKRGGTAPRAVAYFRPDKVVDEGDPAWWLARP